MWKIIYHAEAKRELEALDGSQQKIVLKAICKVSTNPQAFNEGGYGKPLGNKKGNNLTSLLKIKLKNSGLRVVYKLENIDSSKIMRIIIISVRKDNEVYSLAAKRINK